VDILGGDGAIRHYDEGIAFLKLERPSDYSKALRMNGRKLRNSTVTIEGVSVERWNYENKVAKSRSERDKERESSRGTNNSKNTNKERNGLTRSSRKLIWVLKTLKLNF